MCSVCLIFTSVFVVRLCGGETVPARTQYLFCKIQIKCLDRMFDVVTSIKTKRLHLNLPNVLKMTNIKSDWFYLKHLRGERMIVIAAKMSKLSTRCHDDRCYGFADACEA